MIIEILILLISFIIFAYIGDYLVLALEFISHRLKIPETVVGATFAAIGSSAPEFGTSLFSVIEKHPDVGLGTIIGSAIFNILVIIGLSAVFQKMMKGKNRKLDKKVLWRDALFYFVATIFLFLFISDGAVTRTEAIALLLVYGIYVGVMYIDSRRGNGKIIELPEEHNMTSKKAIIYVIGGVLIIFAATHFMVNAIISLAPNIGLSEVVLSLIIVAAGTSIPDLFVSIAAAKRGRMGMAVSNAIGSNTFDILVCLGFPLATQQSTEVIGDIGLSMLFLIASLILIIFMILHKWHISKKEGIILFLLYLIYAAFIFGLFNGLMP